MTDRESESEVDRVVERDDEADQLSDTTHDRTHSEEQPETELQAGSASYDEVATSFFELEKELSPTVPEQSPSELEGTIRGQVVDAGRVSGDTVPEDYPWTVATTEAIVIELSVSDGAIPEEQVSVYFPLRKNGGVDERLARFLDAVGVTAGSFADLHGQTVLVTVEDGYPVPVIPPSAPTGSAAGIYGIYAGLLFNLVFFGMALTLGTAILPYLVVFLVVNLLVLPVSTAVDAWNLRTTTDWRQGPWFWATLAAFPVLNVLTTVAYLYTRRSARSLADP